MTCQWLLEHGGADSAEADTEGDTVWFWLKHGLQDGDLNGRNVAGAVSALQLLKFMVLRGAPLAEFVARLTPVEARVVEVGARLRATLPAYLVQRRALIVAHCPLIAPLRDLVCGHEVPTTTDELWATGLGEKKDEDSLAKT
jgi:hypothetical protein